MIPPFNLICLDLKFLKSQFHSYRIYSKHQSELTFWNIRPYDTALQPFLPGTFFKCSRFPSYATAKYARVYRTKIKCSFVTYATHDGTGTASSHPPPPSQLRSGNVRFVSIRLILNRWEQRVSPTEWLRSVGSLELQVSFAEYRLFYRALLQKRPIILRSLLIIATPSYQPQEPWTPSPCQ